VVEHNGTAKPMSFPGVPLTDAAVEGIAKRLGCAKSDICVMCGIQITMQIFRNSGVCCEQHRKDRDNDNLPFRGGALSP
jgi:hypothetical protein